MSDEQSAELVMPFLPVISRGGPFDDAAYASGWEMGKLDTQLSWPNQPREVVATLREENREQADLVGMRHGYRVEFQHSDVEGWVYMRFSHV